jgi:carboxylesterase type B
VSILTASYHSKRRQLTIEASSSDAPNVTLTAHDAGSGALLGQLSYNRKKGIYTGAFKVSSAPASVLVVSSGGGSDTTAVAGG